MTPARHGGLHRTVAPTQRNFRTWLAVLTAVALGLRTLYAFTLAGPLVGVGDWSYYYLTSNLVAQGNGLSQPFTVIAHGQLVPTALHPPLWSFVLAALSLFTAPASGVGTFSGTALDLHRVLGCAVGAAVVPLVGLLAKRVGGWRVGLLAAAIATVYPRFVILDANLSSEGLFAVIVCAVLLHGYRFADRPTPWRALGLGALVGVAVLTREEALLLVPLLLIPLAWRARESRLLLAGLAVLGTMLVIAPWTVRNYFAFHRFVPVSNSGAVVGGANCHLTYYGSEIGSWQPACLHGIQPSTNEAVQSSRQQSHGINYALDHPARAVLVAGVRLLRVWSLFGPNSQSFGNRTVLWIGTIISYCVLLGAAYGFILLRRRRRSILILIAPILMVCVASILGDGLERLRYPAEVAVLAVAAYAAVALADRSSGPARASAGPA